MTKIRIPEKNIQAAIGEYLTRRQIFWYRQNSGAFQRDGHVYQMGIVGAPDIIAVIEGYYVGLEVKGSGGKQRESQKAFEENLLAAGGIYLLVTSFDEAIEAIEDCIRRVRLKVRPPYQRNKN